MVTEFEWWAEIWIPTAVGAATLCVSAVALWVSHRATVLAKKVEEQRLAAEQGREVDELRRRLVGMAIDEARLLQRWVIEATRPSGFGLRSVPIGSEQPRSAVEQARVNAYVALTQSLVPGADDLLRITSYDLENLRQHIWHDHHDSDEVNERLVTIFTRRIARASTRIRLWGLSPVDESAAVARDLELIEADELAYLMFGEVEFAMTEES